MSSRGREMSKGIVMSSKGKASRDVGYAANNVHCELKRLRVSSSWIPNCEWQLVATSSWYVPKPWQW